MMPRILIVDDDLGTRQTFSVILKLDGWDVRTAADGRQALALAPNFRADVALLDVCLPDMTGIDILRAIVADSPFTKCVMMTAFGSVSSAVQAMKLGAHDYVEKPLTDLEVLRIAGHVGHPPETSLSPNRTYGEPVLDWRVATTLKLLRRRFRESDLSINVIAALLRVSPEHLSRLLKRDTGEGFLLQLNRARIDEAKHLLRHTTLSVKEIAARVGYSNTTRLDIYFRRFSGLAPVAFRQQYRTAHNDRPPDQA